MRIAPFSGSPQAFEIVKFTRPRGEYMNDEIDIVEKDPLAFRVSFDMQRANALFFERFFDVFGNGLVVARRCPGADEEIIGERADLTKFDNYSILGFFVERCFDGVG